MVTTEKISIVNTQKTKRRESKHIATENLLTKENSKRGKKGSKN